MRFLGCSTNDDIDHSSPQDPGAVNRRGQNLEEWFELDRLQTVKGFVNVLKENHTLQPIHENNSVATISLLSEQVS